MNEIDRFVEVQRLWSRYERCEEQLSDLYHITSTVPNTAYDLVIAKAQLIVIRALNEIEEMILDEIRKLRWYEDDRDKSSAVGHIIDGLHSVGGDS